jgi:hypothetical protein
MAVIEFFSTAELHRLAALRGSTEAGKVAAADPAMRAQLEARLQQLPSPYVGLSAEQARRQAERVRAHEQVARLSAAELAVIRSWLDRLNSRPFVKTSAEELRRLAQGVDEVTLGDVSPYAEWVARDRPSRACRLAVAEFLIEIAERYWAAPSAPIEDLSERPVYEAREALLSIPGEGVAQVFYRYTFPNDMVDLIGVMWLRSEDN